MDSQDGTSPHLRGNRALGRIRPIMSRDIPAPTGQPLKTWIPTLHARGHPRTYGATNVGIFPGIIYQGTSPHLRGNRITQTPAGTVKGDIPAPTGQPRLASIHTNAPRGHPRTYGATGGDLWAGNSQLGTSPHLRGNHRPPYGEPGYMGDIPAPTGQPNRLSLALRLSRGHPRTYGATADRLRLRQGHAGTSPHLRGNRPGHRRRRGPGRDIPAPTGQPVAFIGDSLGNWGHPRTYGAT